MKRPFRERVSPAFVGVLYPRAVSVKQVISVRAQAHVTVGRWGSEGVDGRPRAFFW